MMTRAALPLPVVPVNFFQEWGIQEFFQSNTGWPEWSFKMILPKVVVAVSIIGGISIWPANRSINL